MPLKNLVISGGGINGLGFIGIIKYLSENNLLNNIQHYVGTSAGAIIGYLLSIGYNFLEIYEFCTHFNYLHSFKPKFFILPKCFLRTDR